MKKKQKHFFFSSALLPHDEKICTNPPEAFEKSIYKTRKSFVALQYREI